MPLRGLLVSWEKKDVVSERRRLVKGSKGEFCYKVSKSSKTSSTSLPEIGTNKSEVNVARFGCPHAY